MHRNSFSTEGLHEDSDIVKSVLPGITLSQAQDWRVIAWHDYSFYNRKHSTHLFQFSDYDSHEEIFTGFCRH